LQLKLSALDAEDATLAKAETRAIKERHLLLSRLKSNNPTNNRPSVPVQHAIKHAGQPTSHGDNTIVPSNQTEDSFEPAVFKSSQQCEPQQSDLQCLIGNFILMGMMAMMTTSSGRGPAPLPLKQGWPTPLTSNRTHSNSLLDSVPLRSLAAPEAAAAAAVARFPKPPRPKLMQQQHPVLQVGRFTQPPYQQPQTMISAC
jgi:hypothetical protein